MNFRGTRARACVRVYRMELHSFKMKIRLLDVSSHVQDIGSNKSLLLPFLIKSAGRFFCRFVNNLMLLAATYYTHIYIYY